MFLNIDYAKRAAARENNSMDDQSILISDDFDYEQLFDDSEITKNSSKSEIKKPIKRVRFAQFIDENSLTPTLTRPPSIPPRFEIEFDFDSLPSPSNETKDNNNNNWKNDFLNDLHLAKTNSTTMISSPSTIQIDNKVTNDTLWDFMKESNPELVEKLERNNNEKQKRIDRFSTRQPPTKINKTINPISLSDKEGIQIDN